MFKITVLVVTNNNRFITVLKRNTNNKDILLRNIAAEISKNGILIDNFYIFPNAVNYISISNIKKE